MLYEIHMLKNYPPTNLNRDDTGAPKTCFFGGVNRGRISSQCLKRSWRTAELFRQEIGAENLGVRTRQLPALVCGRLREMGIDDERLKVLERKLSAFGNKKAAENTKGNFVQQMVFYAPEDIEAVANRVLELFQNNSCDTPKAVRNLNTKELTQAVADAKVRPVSLDIALFGRMVTSNAFRDVEAAMQVAHAISTNQTMLESDFFTAVDDLIRGESEEERGAGMMDDVDYNSSCYYLYASLDADALRENLKYSEDPDALVRKTLPALLRVMAMSNPSGKQNTFAGHVLPSAMMIECKRVKVPVSLANAFVEPVRPNREGDLIANSIRRLAREAELTERNFGIPVEHRLWFCVDKYNIKPECEVTVCPTFPALVDAAAQTLG